MQRYVVAICALVVGAIGMVAGEGGPLDDLAKNGGRASGTRAEADPGEAVPQPGGAANDASLAPRAVALGSNFGIGDYEATPDEGVDDDSSYGASTSPSDPSVALAANRPGANGPIGDGSLSEERLGVEKPTGLAPIRIEGA